MAVKCSSVWTYRWCVLLCAVLGSPAGVAIGQPAGDTPEPRCIDSLLEEIRDEHFTPALAAAVVHGEDIVAIGAVGRRKVNSKRPADPDSRFHIGSCTKSMTATLVGMLVERGKLRWDMTLAEALPELADDMHADYRSVTLMQLLSHRAGLPSFTEGGAEEFRLLPDEEGTPTEQRHELAATVLSRPPATEPGTTMQYSNAGYGIAGHIVESAAGQPWEELMREKLFEPLGMTDSGFGWPATKENRRQTRGHRALGGLLSAQPINDPYQLPACLAPAGDVYCTIADLARYVSLHLCGLTGRPRLLQAETFERLHTPVGGEDADYALGWGVGEDDEGRKRHRHAGSAGTFFVQIVLIPAEDIAIVVATNAAHEPAQAAGRETIKRLIEQAGQRPD
jgi:CubicO group peptidase (beta-lactamase class C family)